MGWVSLDLEPFEEAEFGVWSRRALELEEELKIAADDAACRGNPHRNAYIRRAAAGGVSYRDLARQFGITYQRVEQIIKRNDAC